ncbi:MAG: 3-dehydroquinate synthetase, partial [Limisphaerales bacterium]
EALFAQANLPTSVRLAKPQLAKVFATMKLDKKVSGGEVKFVLAQKIGHVKFGIDVPKAIINAALK